MDLLRLTMPEFAGLEEKSRGAILPVGAVEQHGPHLPLGFDAMHAHALALAAAELHPCLVAPPLYYGLCRSTSQHPGTVGIPAAALQAVVVAVGKACGPRACATSACSPATPAAPTRRRSWTPASGSWPPPPGAGLGLRAGFDRRVRRAGGHPGRFPRRRGGDLAGPPSLARTGQGYRARRIPQFSQIPADPRQADPLAGRGLGDPGRASAAKGARFFAAEARDWPGCWPPWRSGRRPAPPALRAGRLDQGPILLLSLTKTMREDSAWL